MAQRINRYESGRYEKGSYYQKIFEPMAGGYKLENGTFFVEVTDAYLADQISEEVLRAKFEKIKDLKQIDADDLDEVHA